MFDFALQQELIAKNPMERVEAPSLERHPVDALTPEQAIRFFEVLKTCPLEFRAMLHLLLTTGICRGERMGIQWKDIDPTKRVLHIERGVSYTPRTRIVSVRQRPETAYAPFHFCSLS